MPLGSVTCSSLDHLVALARVPDPTEVRRLARERGVPEAWLERLPNVTGRTYGESGGGAARRLPATSPLFLGAPHAEIAADLPPIEAARELRDHFEAILLLLGRESGSLSMTDLETIAKDRELPEELRRAAATVAEVPDLFRRLARGGHALEKGHLDGALLSLFLEPNALFGEEHEAQFKHWAMKQVETNHHIGHVHRAVIDLLKGEHRPTTVGVLLEEAQRAARESLEKDPLFPSDPRAGQHLILLSALTALAAHALHSVHGEVTCLFPRYIPDGRPGEAGFDKSWHMIDHAMFTFVYQFDRAYGMGDTANDFTRAVDQADEHDAARHIAKVYDETRGALGALLPGTLSGPIGEETLYFAPPQLESDLERDAYGKGVRIGDAHEYLPEFGDPKLIGANLDRDPLAEMDATFDVCSTVRDPGAPRDLTANRIGAWLGIMLFRDPSRLHALPHDDGAHAAGQAFAPERAVPAKEYLALELSQIARALHPNRDAKEAYETSLFEVGELGVEAAAQRLVSELTGLVDQLINADREKLARYYATFSVRYLQFGWRVPIDGEERRWSPHVDFGKGIPRETMLEHFLRRIEATARAFDPPVAIG